MAQGLNQALATNVLLRSAICNTFARALLPRLEVGLGNGFGDEVFGAIIEHHLATALTLTRLANWSMMCSTARKQRVHINADANTNGKHMGKLCGKINCTWPGADGGRRRQPCNWRSLGPLGNGQWRLSLHRRF